MTGIREESHCDINHRDDGCNDLSDLEGVVPTPKCHRLAKEEVLEQSLASGLYPLDVRDCPSYLIQVKTLNLHLCSWFIQHLCVN